LNFGINGSFATYFGWIFPYEKDVILLSDRKEDIALAQRELVRIGIDEPAGAYISGEFDSASSVRTVTFKDIPQVLKDQQVVVLDVRRNSERLASHIAGTIHIPFHELQSRVSELPKDKEIFVHCAGAYRAAAAAGLLELAGLTPVIINESYERALDVVGLEIVERDLDRGSAGLANHEARV
jgi:rhodanese-related sulfurtransferase